MEHRWLTPLHGHVVCRPEQFGYRTDLGVLDARGVPRVGGGRPALPGLWFTGFTNPISGMFRELRIDAERIALGRQMLTEHRAGVVDNSRRLWTVLIFMVWHGIFVEGTITPQIEDHRYPVKL